MTSSTEQINHSERKHHRFGMSRLPYITRCPMWEQEDSDVRSDAAEEGTELHEYMEQVIRGVRDQHKRGQALSARNAFTNLHLNLDNAAMEYLMSACDLLDEVLSMGNVHAILPEIKVKLKRLSSEQVLNWGLLDLLVIYDDNTSILIDWKFGWIPVDPAEQNYQGLGYAIASLQKFPKLESVGVVFCQPKIHLVSQAVVHRAELYKHLEVIERAIDKATWCRDTKPSWSDVAKDLNPGAHCTYCIHAGTCPEKLKQLQSLVKREYPAVVPPSFDVQRIETPEQMALVRFWIDLVEDMAGPLKKAAVEFAKSNGGEISVSLPGSGALIKYKHQSRKVDRVVGAAGLVADELSEFVDEKVVLGAAKLSLTALQEAVVPFIMESINAPLEGELEAAKKRIDEAVAEGKITKSAARKEFSDIKREIKGRGVTKKRAIEVLESTLESAGLLSQPDGTIDMLTFVKQPTTQTEE